MTDLIDAGFLAIINLWRYNINSRMKVSGVASMDKSMDGGSAQSRLKTLLPKNYMIDLNSLYRSLTVKKSDK
jgi:hypothetical protein